MLGGFGRGSIEVGGVGDGGGEGDTEDLEHHGEDGHAPRPAEPHRAAVRCNDTARARHRHVKQTRFHNGAVSVKKCSRRRQNFAVSVNENTKWVGVKNGPDNLFDIDPKS